jgi:hypothetical protein
MKPHPSQYDDHRFDNTFVRMVLYPAVMDYGNSDAENYGAFVLLVKAMVLAGGAAM